ncbi:MAG: NUDIX domain-containing protein [Treponema sp.]|nr:NUDIX domain-containing protein [Treponema sp.]
MSEDKANKNDDIRVGYPDCCFSFNDNWFRYRTGAIIIEDNSFLVVKSETSHYYYSIGGGVHMNEKAEDCVVREVKEETGVDYEIDRLAVICENFFNEKALGYDKLNCHVIEFYFLMKSRGKKDATCNTRGWDNAKESICWIPLEELSDTNVKPDFLRYRMNEILEGKGIIHIITDDR